MNMLVEIEVKNKSTQNGNTVLKNYFLCMLKVYIYMGKYKLT